MSDYAKEQEHGADRTTRLSNMFLLRDDICAMFDAQYFIFVPKVATWIYFNDTMLTT